MQPCFYRVWPAGVLRPAQRQLELLEELLLDRNLLEVTDQTISGSKNAPRLVSLGPDRAEVNVPPANATGVLVLHEMSFARLQEGVPPREEDFRVGVVEFSVRARWVQGAAFSVALLRSLRWDRPGPRDHLVPFRELLRVAPGECAVVQTPAILVVGTAAVELLPSETRLPDSRSQALPLPRSFRLPDEGLPFDAAPKLDTLVNASAPQSLFIGGHDGPVAWEELPRAGAALLKRWERHYRFLPAIVDEREPRLLLLYERGNGEVRTILSEGEIGRWLDALQTALSQTKLAAVWKNLTRREPRAALAKETAKEAQETIRPPPDGRSVPPLGFGAEPVSPLLRADPARAALKEQLKEPICFGAVRTLDPGFAAVLEAARKAASSELTLLLLGESGTGKEHLARAIHDASPRRKGPFVAINCAALQETLVEAALFGHKKGAFTGATADRAGAFVAADGGTLLLDEIGDAPKAVQLTLLRALQSKTVKPVGADTERPVDVRVIAATSQDLRRLIQEEVIRSDLYFRLKGWQLELPPLRERVCDLPLLVDALLAHVEPKRKLGPDAVTALQRYPWPGNVRELENALQRALVHAGDAPVLDAACFDDLEQAPAAPSTRPPFDMPAAVLELAMDAWNQGKLSELPQFSRYEQRAWHRAVLLSLAATHPVATFPPQLQGQRARIFRSEWWSSEDGRGLRDVLRVFGVLPSDERARAWVIEMG